MLADIQVQMRNGHQYAYVEVPNGNYTYCDVPRHPPSNLDKGVNKMNNVNKKLNKKPQFWRKNLNLVHILGWGILMDDQFAAGRSAPCNAVRLVRCSS